MTALSQAAFRALVARARYKSNLHCCAQQILAFRTDRGSSQRTEQNVGVTWPDSNALTSNTARRTLPLTKDK